MNGFTLTFDQRGSVTQFRTNKIFDPDPGSNSFMGDNESVETLYMMSGHQTIKIMAIFITTKCLLLKNADQISNLLQEVTPRAIISSALEFFCCKVVNTFPEKR